MKKILLFLLFALIANTAHAEGSPAPYYIPPNQFNASLQIMDLGFSNVIALFQNATGSFSFNEADKSISRVRLAVDSTSLMTNNQESQHDLSALLGIMQYPEIRITAPDSATFTDGKAELKGNLTIRGTTKPVTLQATLNNVGKSPHGGGMWSNEGQAVGLSLHASFKRADFGMADDPDSPPRFGDTMNLQLEMQALKQ